MKFISFLIISTLFVTNSNAEDKLGTREVLLDNDQVQVVRLSYPPGTESGIHSHEFPNRVAYFISGGQLELVSSDESKDKQFIDAEEGQTLFVPAVTHNVINVGASEVIIIETEIK